MTLWFANEMAVDQSPVSVPTGQVPAHSGFTSSGTVVWTATEGLSGVNFADFDGDGDVDAVVAAVFANGLAWVQNTGQGVAGTLFSPRARQLPTLPSGVTAVTTGDLTG